VVKPGTEINDIMSHEDWLPTFMSAAGQPDIKAKLMKGYQAGDKTYKVHLDGYDQTELFAGRSPGQRKEFFYWTDDGQLAALRYEQWKLVFQEQNAHGLRVWMNPLTALRVPLLFSLRADPFERSDHESGGYDRWFIEHVFVMVPAQAFVAQHLATYKEFPPRQKVGTFTLDRVMEQLLEPSGGNK
jgi:arylsulfatase